MYYFIGLIFSSKGLQYYKVDSFRRKFDYKYEDLKPAQMALLPPFNLEIDGQSKVNEWVDELAEDAELHLDGLDDVDSVEFNGLDLRHGNKGITIYLKPTLPINLSHYRQQLYGSLDNEGATFKKIKKTGRVEFDWGGSFSSLLPIGRIKDKSILGLALESAEVEFNSSLYLQPSDICLFEKIVGKWTIRRKLFSFRQRESDFLHDSRMR